MFFILGILRSLHLIPRNFWECWRTFETVYMQFPITSSGNNRVWYTYQCNSQQSNPFWKAPTIDLIWIIPRSHRDLSFFHVLTLWAAQALPGSERTGPPFPLSSPQAPICPPGNRDHWDHPWGRRTWKYAQVLESAILDLFNPKYILQPTLYTLTKILSTDTCIK